MRADSGPDVTTDGLLNHRVRVRQPATGYRVAIDPVFLAAAVPASAGARVLDAGTGVGAAALCLLARVPGCYVAGIEIQDRLASLAQDNARLNGRSDRFDVVVGDIRHGAASLGRAQFDHVMANPPFNPPGSAASRLLSRDVAVREGDASLATWLNFCRDMVRPAGTVTIIHRPEREDELVAAFPRSAISLFPLLARSGGEVRRLVFQARLGAVAGVRRMTGMVLHDEDGRFSPAAEAVLRHAAALDWTVRDGTAGG
ncbi:MAG: methyltransferase [Alphaproteobacteria bacterium]